MSNRQKVKNGATGNEQKKRDVILALKRNAVLIQIRTNHLIPELHFASRDYDEEVKNENRALEAEKKGLNPMAYMRGKPDTGTQVLCSNDGARITGLIEQLKESGLHYVGGWHYENDRDAGVVNRQVYNFLFSVDGKEIPIPKEATKLFNFRFVSTFIWANPRDDGSGKRIRTDSIVLSVKFYKPSMREPMNSQGFAKAITMIGNTYRLV